MRQRPTFVRGHVSRTWWYGQRVKLSTAALNAVREPQASAPMCSRCQCQVLGPKVVHREGTDHRDCYEAHFIERYGKRPNLVRDWATDTYTVAEGDEA